MNGRVRYAVDAHVTPPDGIGMGGHSRYCLVICTSTVPKVSEKATTMKQKRKKYYYSYHLQFFHTCVDTLPSASQRMLEGNSFTGVLSVCGGGGGGEVSLLTGPFGGGGGGYLLVLSLVLSQVLLSGCPLVLSKVLSGGRGGYILG